MSHLGVVVTATQDTFFGARKAPRTPQSLDVILTYTDPARGGILRSKVINRSEDGFGVQLAEALEVGSVVMLVGPSLTIDCDVVWTRRTEAGCRSGLRIRRHLDLLRRAS